MTEFATREFGTRESVTRESVTRESAGRESAGRESDETAEAPADGPGGDFVLVCSLDDLPTVGAAAAEIDGQLVAVVRDGNGHVHAVDDTCTHANVSLSEGEVDGCTLECWLHGSRFDLVTGQPTGPPAIIPVAVYPVAIVGDSVWISPTPKT